MPFMILGGVTVPVLERGADRENVLVGGEPRRNILGEPLIEHHGSKFLDSYETRPMTSAEVAALKAAIANGVAVSGDGDFVDNVPTNVRAFITREVFRRINGVTRKMLRITVMED